MKEVKVYAPATIANVGCGYDTIGFALEDLYEEIVVSRRDDDKINIHVEGANLPSDPKENVAGVAADALMKHVKVIMGLDIHIKKLFRPGSGLGSSASSAAGTVFAVNQLLPEPLATDQLLPFALEGEAFASKCYHADNVAPSLLGGFIAIRSYDPLDYFSIPVAKELQVLVARPAVEVKTSEAKNLVPKQIDVSTARNQWGNVASLIHAMHSKDWKRLKDSIEDFIAEPVRKSLIPFYLESKAIAENCGCVGFNISGSGPSFFMLFESKMDLSKARKRISELYQEKELSCEFFESKMSENGCKVVL